MTVESQLSDAARAITAGDWDRLRGLLSDRFFGYSPGDDEPTAAERIVEILSALKAAMPDLMVSFTDTKKSGGMTSTRFSIEGTHLSPLWGAPGSGNSISWSSPATARAIDGGLAIRFDDVTFPDLVALLRQLGMVNPPDQMDQPLSHPVSVPEFLLKVIMTGEAGDRKCTHLAGIRVTDPATRMCAPCFSQGVNWPALRMCLTCGFVGCCDTSRNKHARAHHEETGHPMMRSIRMDEGWVWCYEDNAFFEKRILERFSA